MNHQPCPLNPQLIERLQRVRLLALDVDGVLTDGQLSFDSDGRELKSFSVLDGHGLKLAKRFGIEVALITGRDSPMVARRAAALGIKHLFQGVEDKLPVLRGLCQQLGLSLDEVAYCGDDMPDLASIHHSAIGISVPNAPDYIQQQADWITERAGGQGAAREICDTLLRAQGHWDALLESYLQNRG